MIVMAVVCHCLESTVQCLYDDVNSQTRSDGVVLHLIPPFGCGTLAHNPKSPSGVALYCCSFIQRKKTKQKNKQRTYSMGALLCNIKQTSTVGQNTQTTKISTSCCLYLPHLPLQPPVSQAPTLCTVGQTR